MSGPTVVLPPLDGSLIVFPGFVDFQAQNNPDKPWVIYPTSGSSPTNTREISYLEFAKATHRIAHAIRPGRAGPEQEVVALIINTDNIINVTLFIGMIRAGIVVSILLLKWMIEPNNFIQPFPISARNSYHAICHMLEKSECHRIIMQSSMASLIQDVATQMHAKGFKLQIDELPCPSVAYPEMFSGHNQDRNDDPYPPRSPPPEPDELCFYLHSSGSTGFPKSIPIKHKMTLQYCKTGGCIRRMLNIHFIHLSSRQYAGCSRQTSTTGINVRAYVPFDGDPISSGLSLDEFSAYHLVRATVA